LFWVGLLSRLGVLLFGDGKAALERSFALLITTKAVMVYLLDNVARIEF
jgi:hypothetical protein